MDTFKYHSAQNLHGIFKIPPHHLSNSTYPELSVWLQTYIHTTLSAQLQGPVI